jgi:eukaryotic-like serine/threonine-protein kinase
MAVEGRSPHWQRVEEVFAEVAPLAPEEREARLARLAGGDADLEREVRSLLAADGEAGDFLEGPALSDTEREALTQAARAAAPALPAAGRRIGPYRILRRLGQGGMGTVYLAARDDLEYSQQVAIKVFSSSTDRADLLRRFRAERQILARLEHPNIARLLDGGTTEEGLPYLVMEYVDGVPIDQYCDSRGLDVDARLALVLQVAAAVQYAHQNLVIHRDLKPGNILVAADGTPRLLDFGIAKLLDSDFPLTAAATRTGQRLMTPQYASPEQVEGGAITTATDVYGLGLLLYLLLTGRLPYRVTAEHGRAAGPLALERAVLEQEPERPSTAARQATEQSEGSEGSKGPKGSSGMSGRRGRSGLFARLGRIRTGLDADLDNIVLLALRKEPQRRYASVALLAEDLRRFRAGLPVQARPATLRYRAAKFVRRHRLGVGLAAGLLAVILGLAAVSTVQALRLARQRDEIRDERDKAVEVARFLEEIFQVSNPGQAQGETVTAREILDQAAARMGAELQGQPEVEAALATTMGNVYRELGLPGRAQPLLDRSLELRRRTFGDRHPQVAESLHALGLLAILRGELPRAEALHRRALALRRELLEEDDPRIAESLNGLGAALLAQADYPEAERVLRRALDLNRRHFGRDHPDVAEGLNNLGLLHKQKGDLAGAEALYREGLGIWRRLYGEKHPALATQLNNLAALQVERGDLAGAEASARESLAVALRIYGPEHPEIALQLNNLGSALLLQGKATEAEPLLRRSLALRRKLLGPEHEQVAMGLNNLGRLLHDQGDLARARPLYEEGLRISLKVFGEEHPRTATALANVAALLGESDDPAAAEPLARRALAARRKVLGEDHADTGAALTMLGTLRLKRGAPAEAEPLLRQGLGVLHAALGDEHWRTADAQSQLGACLAARGKDSEAEPLLVAGYETLAKVRGPNHRKTVTAGRRLVAFYEARGDRRAAAEWRARLPG